MSTQTYFQLKDSFAFTEKTKNKYKPEDFAQTMGCIQARRYSLTREALKDSSELNFSRIDKIITPDNYQENRDKFDERLKKWTFSFCGRSPTGDYFQATVCLDSDRASILNVKRLKKDSSTLDEAASKYDENYNTILGLIAKKKFSYSKHAKERMHERNVTKTMVRQVLLKGAHEVTGDRFVDGKWRFAFRDEVGSKDIRCIVVGEDDHILIITAIDLSTEEIIINPPADFTSLPSNKSFKKVQDRSDESSFDDLLRSKVTKSASHSLPKSSEEPNSPSASKQGKKRKADSPSSETQHGAMKKQSKRKPFFKLF